MSFAGNLGNIQRLVINNTSTDCYATITWNEIMTLHVHVHSMFMKEQIFRGEQGSGLNEMHFELKTSGTRLSVAEVKL